ncbi:hypothetical protein OOK39_16700 [Streptomyces sp. NBC_00264]|uniref:hypothetical protein n=1 Tax=unclassified Streptomyces TaxID=2593676 RepID=UPI00224E17E6|nr:MULTISPECIES: hypothetical protein [unclassified Streptomyces]MCX5160903.1 hypothetical protein [Streptomyces sp. NBC_00305]MCX5219426.1 hypothetical protein [Streptomyces sp. NBC_00264]WSC29572.1 hypothetical protein OG902_24370 [Streptomyces sp. NBC_01768]
MADPQRRPGVKATGATHGPVVATAPWRGTSPWGSRRIRTVLARTAPNGPRSAAT